MPDKPQQASNPNSASWVPFAVLASLALGNLLDKPVLESDRPAAGRPDLPNPTKLQAYPETLSGDPLKVLTNRKLSFDLVERSWTLESTEREGPIPSVPLVKLEGILDKRHAWRVLPVIVNGGFGPVDTERRRRTRYAVVSGLARAGYVPFDAHHMGATRFEIPLTSGAANEMRRGVAMTFERFGVNDVFQIGQRYIESRPGVLASDLGVLVLWINWNDLLDTRLDDLLKELYAAVWRDGVKRDICCIAAINSDATIRVFENLTKGRAAGPVPPKPLQKTIDIYLPRATLPSANILRCASARAGKPLDAWVYKPEWNLDSTGRQEDDLNTCELIQEVETESWRSCGIRFVRTQCDDTKMVKLIKNELDLRGRSVTEHSRNVNLLIGEWDTSYSRALRNKFIESYDDAARERIISIGYVRGVDEGLEKAQEPKLGVNSPSPGASETVGESQMDYIRRAELEMGALNLRLEALDHEISAVGILGTDVYDKVVIVQAVKQIFPTSVIFTTDLDAIYCDPDRFDRYRNLLIASTYGLVLNEFLQGPIPPFRESLQTSTLFATLKAVGFDFEGVVSKRPTSTASITGMPAFEPRMFEIGRSGPFDLTGGVEISRRHILDRIVTSSPLPLVTQPVRGNSGASIEEGVSKARDTSEVKAAGGAYAIDMNPPSRRGSVVVRWIQDHWLKTSLVVVLAMLASVVGFTAIQKRLFPAITALAESRPIFCWIIASASVLALSFGLVSLVAFVVLPAISQHPNHEPFEFLEGISVWPSVLLKLFMILAAAVFALLTLHASRRIPVSSEGPMEDIRLLESSWKALRAISDLVVRCAVGVPRLVKRVVNDGPARALADLFGAAKSSCIYEWKTLTWKPMDPGASYKELQRRLSGRVLGSRAVVFVAFLAVLSPMIELHDSPARGFARHVDDWLSIASWLALIGVVFLSTAVVRTVQHFVKLQLDGYRQYFYSRRQESTLEDFSHTCLVECQYLRDVTAVGLRRLYPPSILILVMLLCYNPLFDAWHWSLWLPVPFVAISVVLIASAWLLSYRAMEIRRDLIEGLRKSMELSAPKTRALVNRHIDRIVALEGGAFTRFVDMPLVHAVMIPISGLGGISALQHLTPLMQPK